jgi:hypothetical protein
MNIQDQITAWKSLPLIEKISMSYLWYFVLGTPVLLYILCFSPWAKLVDAEIKASYKSDQKLLYDPATREQELAKRYHGPDNYSDFRD